MMDRTARTLTDLSAVDDQLSGKDALMDGRTLALEQHRAALREAIPRDFLAAYDALGRVGRRPVVVEVRGGHCSGCYLRLQPQLDSTIRRRQSLCSCPHCGRLLYSPTRVSDSEGAPESKHETADRLAGNVTKSKRAREISGKRRTRQEARPSKR
jgi:predicted  nucleic acid-binding Zn-ribbon protein